MLRVPIGWNEIKEMTEGTVERHVTDNTLPTGPVERTITYVAPFTKCDRERDYAQVWMVLEAVSGGEARRLAEESDGDAA